LRNRQDLLSRQASRIGDFALNPIFWRLFFSPLNGSPRVVAILPRDFMSRSRK
jgi:hypothetical protein